MCSHGFHVLRHVPTDRLLRSLAKDIREEEFYLIDTFGHVKTVSFDAVSESLEQGTVSSVAYFSLRTPFLTTDISPTAGCIRLVGKPSQLAFVGSEEAPASHIYGQFQIFQVGCIQSGRNRVEIYFQTVLHPYS